tara:strand:- start:475 stop:1407 length:933 start_codon:yes stop_codon:yes gene_type:complete
LEEYHEVFPFGPGYSYYQKNHQLNDVLKIAKFTPDLICFGAGWEWEGIWGDNEIDFDPQPSISLSNSNIPSVMILNKEYKKLDKKFDFIKKNKISMVFTAHHNYRKWEKKINVRFNYFPFAIDNKNFNDHRMSKIYDFGFSGSLHKKWTDIRGRVKSKLFYFPKLIKSIDQNSNKLIKRSLLRDKNIFWNEEPFNNYYGKKYSMLLNSSKIWLCTTSAIDLVGTRFYEIMASKSLLFCNRSEAYNSLFIDGEHCIMFENDLTDFEEKLSFYIHHAKEREVIVNNAYEHVMKNHTWSNRIDLFTKAISKIL